MLCFDEMHITDIADAMIVGRLFKALFEEQVVVVTTSNAHPRDLYKNGLNRPLFLPFIDLIQTHMDVEELAAAKDFRLEKLAGKPLYFTPADAKAKGEMDRIWLELTGGQDGSAAGARRQGPQVESAAGCDGRCALLIRRAVQAAARNDRLPGARAQVPYPSG